VVLGNQKAHVPALPGIAAAQTGSQSAQKRSEPLRPRAPCPLTGPGLCWFTARAQGDGRHLPHRQSLCQVVVSIGAACAVDSDVPRVTNAGGGPPGAELHSSRRLRPRGLAEPLPQRVSSNSSRPMSILRISEVPAPIS